jgi:hypothetical protein
MLGWRESLDAQGGTVLEQVGRERKLDGTVDSLWTRFR